MIRKLVDFALNNQYVVLAIGVLLLAWGAVSFHNMPVEVYPDIADNYVQIISQWSGRSAEEMEQQVTIPMETGLYGTPELDQIRSISIFGLSDVKMYFTFGSDYFIDRQAQKTESFTGIKGVNTQDVALQEGMGAIVDRTREHLGTSDRAIVVMRRTLLEAMRAVESGKSPPGIDPQITRSVRPHDGLVPAGVDWRETFAEALKPRW